ncbi:MAG: hypothetical protein JW779_05010 [Candidatus Thorarchaeota archaeon]|nr:hypothetical protein [Candidatus Thorarchaeota archaeon]
MTTICPYCREDLRLELTAQFVERVDTAITDLYPEELERLQKRAAIQGGMYGGMMKMAAGMAKGMQSTMIHMMQGIVEYPPIVTILKCMNCGAALSVDMPTSGSSK